jgi:hypothetical protein
MPKLTVLDMQLNHVKELKIGGMNMGMYLLFNLGVGERGAQFIVQNFKNLTTLYISKQLSDSGNNSVGDSGATAIANNLKKLTYLDICK